ALAAVALSAAVASAAPPATPSSASSPDPAQRRRAAAAAQKGAVIVRAGDARDLLSAYEEIGARGRPLFISSDLVLHRTRRVIGAAIADVEEKALLPLLQEVTGTLLDGSLFDVKQFKGEVRRSAASWNAGYFAVAVALLGGQPLDEARLAPLEN